MDFCSGKAAGHRMLGHGMRRVHPCAPPSAHRGTSALIQQ